jgi:predicted PurR-regulated permease PerM
MQRLRVSESVPASDEGDLLANASRVATIGIFCLLLCALLYFARAVVAPIVAAAIVANMFGPLAALAERYRIPRPLFALACLVVVLVAVNALFVVLGDALSYGAGRIAEIGAALKSKAAFLDPLIATVQSVQNGLATVLGSASSASLRIEPSMSSTIGFLVQFLTPALGGVILFFVGLFFFLLSQKSQRQFVALLFDTSRTRLTALRLLTAIERNLAQYLAVVTVINFCVGLVTAIVAYLVGLPNPLLFGAAAFLFNYVPYLGPAAVVTLLFVVGLVVLPTLAEALLAPALIVAVNALEGQFITPSIIGRRLTLSPLAIFLSIAFWTWLWGPLGTLLATPILLIATTIYQHVVRPDEQGFADWDSANEVAAVRTGDPKALSASTPGPAANRASE